VGVAPAHPLTHEDGADLAAFDRDPSLLGRLRQRIEAPLGLCFFVACYHRAIPLRHQPPRRGLLDQRDQLAVILSRQAAGSTRFGSIAQPLQPLGIKAMDPTTHRLRVALQLLGNRFDALSISAASHYSCMQHPIGWPVPTPCQFAYLLLFLLILWRSHAQDLRHVAGSFPCVVLLPYFITF
jgi:hypothetical protein